jgi:hypothetical protein
MEWWDGTQFHIYDGSAWQTVGPVVGAANPTTQKVFEVGTNSGSTLDPVAGTPTIALINGSPTLNTQGVWSVSNHTYTPNKPGVYNFEIFGGNGNSSYLVMYLIKNDTGPPLNVSGSAYVATAEAPITGFAMQGSGMVQMNGTTDFVRLWAQGGNASAAWGMSNIPNIRAYALP